MHTAVNAGVVIHIDAQRGKRKVIDRGQLAEKLRLVEATAGVDGPAVVILDLAPWQKHDGIAAQLQLRHYHPDRLDAGGHETVGTESRVEGIVARRSRSEGLG